MCPLFVNAESRERHAPGQRLLAELFCRLVIELDQAAAEHPGGLFCKEIDELCDLRIVAEAYCDLLQGCNVQDTLEEWHQFARRRLGELRMEEE